MARVSRMQRFAGLREELANSNERKEQTNVLDEYAEKLKNLSANLGKDLTDAFSKNNINLNNNGLDGFVNVTSIEEEKPRDKETEKIAHIANDIQEINSDDVVDDLNEIVDDTVEIIEKPENKEELPIATFEEEETKKLDDLDIFSDELNKILSNDNDNDEIIDNTIVIDELPIQEEDFTIDDKTEDLNNLFDEKIFVDDNVESNDSAKEKPEDISYVDEKVNGAEQVIEEEIQQEGQEEVKNEDLNIVEVAQTTVEPVVVEIQKITKNIEPINEDEVVNNLLEIIGPLDDLKVKEKVVKNVEEDNSIKNIIDKVNDEISKEEEPIDVATINESLKNEIINEVKEYNRQEGNASIEDISNNIINEVVHGKEGQEDTIQDDKEFSNTVSLSIDKVLQEVKESIKENNQEETKVFEQNLKDELVTSLDKPIEEGDDVVQILPMEETLKLDVVDDTIPFAGLQEEDDEEEVEDVTFSRAINIILIVLIVVLIAILAVIGYYLLYAGGIIQ